MQKWRQCETADSEEWQLALEREAVIRPLASKSKLSVTLIEEATRQLRLSRTVFMIYCAATSSGRKLLPFFPGREGANSRPRSRIETVQPFVARSLYELVSIMRGPTT